MSDRTQEARERAERIMAIEECFCPPPERQFADDVLFLADRVSTLETALREIRDRKRRISLHHSPATKHYGYTCGCSYCVAWAEATEIADAALAEGGDR